MTPITTPNATPTIIQKDNILDTVLTIIRRKEAWEKEGRAIKRLEAIYQNEISEASKQLHKTR